MRRTLAQTKVHRGNKALFPRSLSKGGDGLRLKVGEAVARRVVDEEFRIVDSVLGDIEYQPVFQLLVKGYDHFAMMDSED